MEDIVLFGTAEKAGRNVVERDTELMTSTAGGSKGVVNKGEMEEEEVAGEGGGEREGRGEGGSVRKRREKRGGEGGGGVAREKGEDFVAEGEGSLAQINVFDEGVIGV